jgi:hypothetical protein
VLFGDFIETRGFDLFISAVDTLGCVAMLFVWPRGIMFDHHRISSETGCDALRHYPHGKVKFYFFPLRGISC